MLAQTATDFSIAFPMFMLSTLLFGFIIGTLITVIPFWMICSKAGFPGALALLRPTRREPRGRTTSPCDRNTCVEEGPPQDQRDSLSART